MADKLPAAVDAMEKIKIMTCLTEPFFTTRGVVLTISDITTWNWMEKAQKVGLNTIATHGSISDITNFLRTDQGAAFLEACETHGIQVEHELHAMRELLPRHLFSKEPEMFRINEEGQRVPDANLCIHSKTGIRIVCENVVAIAESLKPSTGRFFFWIDDGKPMCRCPECEGISDSDQALIIENNLIGALRKVYPKAALAHLAYKNTLTPPTQVKPEPGVFLEFAPITRSFELPLSCREKRLMDSASIHAEYLNALDANLEVFGRDQAQALEYWLDVSLFSRRKREKVIKLPWNRDVFLDDLQTYSDRGIHKVTSFAVGIDGDYVSSFGESPVQEYGEGLLRFKQNQHPT